MKRRILLIALLLALAAALGYAAYAGAKAPSLFAIEPTAERDFVHASLTCDAGSRTLRGTQRMTITNRTEAALTEVVLRLYMNGENEGSVVVAGVTANGESVSSRKDEDDPTVLRIPLDWQPGQTVELTFTLMITHEKAEDAAVITLPSLAMLEEGAWRTDGYDVLAGMSHAQAFDYVIELDGVCAARMRGARDASFALQTGGKVRSAMAGNVRITALGATGMQARRLLSSAKAALDDLEKLGFAYPFDTLTVAVSQSALQDGMALSGLIALREEGDGEQLRRQLVQGIARQIFGVYIESDPWNAPWLSYAPAAALEMLSYRQRRGAAAYEERLYGEMEIASRVTRPYGVCVGAGVSFFGSESEMKQVLCDQGGAMLLGIEAAVGEEAFLAALHAYVQRCAGHAGTQQALEAALLETTGSDWSGYLADELAF